MPKVDAIGRRHAFSLCPVSRHGLPNDPGPARPKGYLHFPGPAAPSRRSGRDEFIYMMSIALAVRASTSPRLRTSTIRITYHLPSWSLYEVQRLAKALVTACLGVSRHRRRRRPSIGRIENDQRPERTSRPGALSRPVELITRRGPLTECSITRCSTHTDTTADRGEWS